MSDESDSMDDQASDIEAEIALNNADAQWRFTDEVDGHKWGFWKKDTYECCRYCGYVRRADKNNRPCPGKPRIDLR